MSTTIECPFTVGASYWVARHGAEQVRVTCPVCHGQLAITVILGDGERVVVPCESCGIGFRGPRGFIEEYVYEPNAEQVTVTGIDSIPRDMSMGDDWRLRTESHGYTYAGRDLYPTQAEAYAESVRKVAEAREENMRRSCHRRNDATKRTGWTVRYHREQIKKLRDQLAWHEAKVLSPAVLSVPSRPGEDNKERD